MCKPKYMGDCRRTIRIAKDEEFKTGDKGKFTKDDQGNKIPLEDHEKDEFGTAKGLQNIVDACCGTPV